jgi:protein SCO1/2
MRRGQFLRGSAALLLGGSAGSVVTTWSAPAASSVAIPDVEVVDQFGRRLRFYDDLVRGRALLLNVFFSSCGDTCPLVTQNLREVQDLLGDRMGKDIFMVSIALQPELETPDILHDYAVQWEARPGWSFVTGRPADIELLRRSLGFADTDPAYADDRDSHTGMVRYGNDRLDRWTATAGLARPAWIAKAVTSLADMG